jgi:hypothetical protein
MPSEVCGLTNVTVREANDAKTDFFTLATNEGYPILNFYPNSTSSIGSWILNLTYQLVSYPQVNTTY